MSTAAIVAGVEVAKEAVKVTKKVIKVGRKVIAIKELRDAKDYDGNVRIGSVGKRKRVQRPARG